MIRSATLNGEQANRRHLTLANGTGYWRSDLMLSSGSDSPAPQAFLIEQDPNTVIPPHFHEQDQFQIVAEGSGTLGRHPVVPINVHYASRHTGYGPIVAGEHGLSYFTLRAVTTPYAHFLPESRAKMRDLPRRNLLGPSITLCGAAQRRASSESAVAMLIEPQPDGVAAWLLRVPPNTAIASPGRDACGGRFYLVADGAMYAQGARLPRFSIAFVSADEQAFDSSAGEEGAEVLILQFPKQADLLRAR